MRAQALAFSVRSGLFEPLAESPATPEKLGLAPRAAPTLLAFLSSQGLVERDEEGRFHTTLASDTFLVQSSPRFAGGRSLLFQGRHSQIGRLGEVLGTGDPLPDTGTADSFEIFSKDDQRWFAEGMLANAVSGARYLQGVMDFSPFRRLIDVGGSSGGYTMALLEAYPSLEATIFDLEDVRPLTEERIASLGLQGRCRFVGGSFFEDTLPGGHDLLLLANILHDWDASQCDRILAACHTAVEPGGTIVLWSQCSTKTFPGPLTRVCQRPHDGAPGRREPHSVPDRRNAGAERDSQRFGSRCPASRTAS